MPYGYNGRILHVDLNTRSWDVEEPGDQWYRTYMGGSALAGYYLLRELDPEVEPLSAENILVFACSAVTGAPISGFSRYTVAAKSPLTGGFGESEAGGYWGPELKFAGYDGIVVRGRAPEPVYLCIRDGQVEIRDARFIWGLDNWLTLERIRKELGDKRIRVASIGPAGERLVRFANVGNDLEHFNGRTGMGAVMGSKQLKAVAVRGTKRPDYADPDAVKAVARWHNGRIKTHPPNLGLTRAGTPGLLKGLNAAGTLPTRNFREGVFEGAGRINWDAYRDTIYHSSGTCYACTVKCKRRVALQDEKYPLDPRFGGPEYEALAALGSMIGNDNLPALARGNQLCNLLGMDVISAGATTAFAMECFEAGILNLDDTGRPLGFGDADAMLWLIEQMGYRKGLGEILSEGVKRAAGTIGKGAEAYSFHVKGQEMPLHDGRGKTGVALSFALSPTGADHIETPHDVAFKGDGVKLLAPLGILEPIDPLITDPAKVRFFARGQKAWGINNCLGICNFTSVPLHAMTFSKLVAAVSAITGWDTSLFEIMQVAERSNVMARVFNNRAGFGTKDDRLPRRMYEALPGGPLAGRSIDPERFREAIDLYYDCSGWDDQGRPTRGKLTQLNLEWLLE